MLHGMTERAQNLEIGPVTLNHNLYMILGKIYHLGNSLKLRGLDIKGGS